jgi:transposase
MVSTLNPGKLCWIDQSGMQDNERSLWGWSLRGLLCLGIKPARATEKSNIMAGLMQGKLIAPIQYATNTTAMIVEEWFENKLLKVVAIGTVFVLDNAPFHRKKILEAMACAAGCSILWLPPYAPDLNKIENSWATIKHYARKFLQRTGADLKRSILRAIVLFQKVKP